MPYCFFFSRVLNLCFWFFPIFFAWNVTWDGFSKTPKSLSPFVVPQEDALEKLRIIVDDFLGEKISTVITDHPLPKICCSWYPTFNTFGDVEKVYARQKPPEIPIYHKMVQFLNFYNIAWFSQLQFDTGPLFWKVSFQILPNYELFFLSTKSIRKISAPLSFWLEFLS